MMVLVWRCHLGSRTEKNSTKQKKLLHTLWVSMVQSRPRVCGRGCVMWDFPVFFPEEEEAS